MSKTPSAPPGQSDDATYAIRVRGHLDPRWVARLAVSSLVHETDGTTTLHATRVDQAALHGLLQQVRSLGLILVSVVNVNTASEDASPPNPNS